VLVCGSCGHENSEVAKFCEQCGFSLALVPERAQEQRKTVTVLFCDVTGSTALGEALDPERLRAMLARYFERMKAVVERHGGTVEKFIGDAVMAVFGVPLLHEDDALRAMRAAVEMRDALPELGLEARIGVMTGEVVTGTEERLATGDAVNVAARLEQAAEPGEVLVGGQTLALVGDAAEVEPVEPLELKGKAEPVPAYRLLRIREAPERSHGMQFVGREHELALLREAWERAQAGRRCELVTVVGDAGVGKSRLAAEFLTSIEATIVRGRCLPYGEGITYWPVVEVLKQLDVLPAEEAAKVAIRSVLGESEAATSAEDIAWAFRKTIEQAAAERPLVVVFDDIQWGEETFHDLIEHVALLSSGASILLLCIARRELTERRPSWPVMLRLEPLGNDAVEELIPKRIAGELREKITRAAAGNPLFIGEMLAMADEAEGEVAVPPTLQALLAARLDELEAAERSVLERGAVEGELFHRGAVQALGIDDTQVTPRLAALVRKQLVGPDKTQLRGEDAFRFRHLLIRDAAYNALPKAVRAELHERFAAWLEQRGTELVELDEILGYHLEQACLYRVELGLPFDDELAATARGRLVAPGHRAQLRSDHRAAASFLERASALVPAGEIDLGIEIEIIDALYWGGDREAAFRKAEALTVRGTALGDEVVELSARIQAGFLALDTESTEPLVALVEQALPTFETARDDVALFTACHALAFVEFQRAQTDAALGAFERAVTHARRSGLPHELLGWRALCRMHGSTPVSELLAWLDENELRGGRDHWFRGSRAMGLAMLGHFDDARAILAEIRSELVERGGGIPLATLTGIESALVELLAGDPAAAAVLGAEGCRMFEELGDEGFFSSAAAALAEALYELDRLGEAELWAGRSADLGASDDAFNQMSWRTTRAKMLARGGRPAEAMEIAREAVAIGETTDWLNGQADAYASLAEVFLLAGKPDEAAASLEQAIERYERKGNLVSTGRAQARLAEVDRTASR
jgi:class 3 adenylate cyclase/tetratricopeptide (TPR) repeat protein